MGINFPLPVGGGGGLSFTDVSNAPPTISIIAPVDGVTYPVTFPLLDAAGAQYVVFGVGITYNAIVGPILQVPRLIFQDVGNPSFPLGDGGYNFQAGNSFQYPCFFTVSANPNSYDATLQYDIGVFNVTQLDFELYGYFS